MRLLPLRRLGGVPLDPLTALLAILAGTVAGFVAGLIPGLHPNTLIPVAAATGLGAPAAVALTSAAFAHGFSSLLPATYLGVPDPDTPLTMLPAHRMLMHGHAREAVLVGAWATLAAIVAVAALALPYKWLLAEPARLRMVLTPMVPWICLAVALLMVASERRKGWQAMAWAAGLWGASGWLALAAARLPLQPVVPVPSSPMVPVLAGLFGAAGLVASLAAGGAVPPQMPPAPPAPSARRSIRTGTLLGIGAGLWTSAIPGLTAGVAASLARAPTTGDGAEGSVHDARPALATLAATGAAHAGFTLLLLWVASQARTGLAQGVRELAPPASWVAGAVPRDLALALAAAVAASLAAWAGVRALDAPAARLAQRAPARLLAGAALVLILAAALAMSGPWGVPVLGAALLLGLVPHATGVRRIHLVGSLIVPLLWTRWGPV